MDQYVGSLIGRYRSAGLLVDTNVLLLHFVGAYEPGLIERFARTKNRGFVPEDFYTLGRVIEQFERVVATPHILTEVSNWLGYLEDPAKSACFRRLAEAVRLMREPLTPASTLSLDPAFVLFGITDASIRDAAAGTYLVLTDDLPLADYLGRQGVDVLNFNNIRLLGY